MADDGEVKKPLPQTGEREAGDDSGSGPQDDKFERLYETHIGRLIATAMDDFGVPGGSAVVLAHEVMLSLLSARGPASDTARWLDVAVALAAEAYSLRDVVIPGPLYSSGEVPDVMLPNGVAWRAVAERLTPRFRRVLELRYVEGRTVDAIAETLGTTTRYVEILLDRCLRQAKRTLQ